MTVIDRPLILAAATGGPEWFEFPVADWALYEQISRALEDRRVFLTFYKGRLELAAVSLLHDRIVGLLTLMIWALAEETDTRVGVARMTTLRRVDLQIGVEPDASFYTRNAGRMAGKTDVDLASDPPPDLAVEVEATRRLGARRTMYQDVGVPELWRYADGVLHVLLLGGQEYLPADRSPTFPHLSPPELAGFVAAGLAAEDQTAWIKSFRRRVREAIGAGRS